MISKIKTYIDEKRKKNSATPLGNSGGEKWDSLEAMSSSEAKEGTLSVEKDSENTVTMNSGN